MDQTAEAGGTPGVYISYDVNYYSQMWKTYPYKTIGKLFFQSATGTPYYCTATVISPNNIIVTAAHCVYNTDTNKWYKSWVFIPAYRYGSAPYGTFPYVSARVLTAWINAPNSTAGLRYNVAVIRLGNNSEGHPVTYYTGYAGRSWNQPYNILNFNAGYPDPGEYLSACMNESYKYSTDVALGGCNLKYGMGGGPWFRKYAPYKSGACNYVNDVNAGWDFDSPNIYGARFSNSNIVPLCTDEGC